MNSCHTALVVGASRGIGVALAQQLLQDPGIQRVYATYRKNVTAEALLAIDDERLRTLQVDVTNDEDLQRLAKNIRVNQDSPDFVINAKKGQSPFLLYTTPFHSEQRCYNLLPERSEIT